MEYSLVRGISTTVEKAGRSAGQPFPGNVCPSGDSPSCGQPDVPGEAEQGESADDPVARVELPPPQTVAGRGRKSVVIVVPSFPQGQDAEEEIVPTVVVGRVGLATPQMTDGVDAPGHVVGQAHPDEAAPQEAEEGARPGSRQEATQNGRDQQAVADPYGEQGAHRAQGATLVEVPGVVEKVRWVGMEDPSQVRVPDATHQAEDALALVVRRMGILPCV